MHVVAKGETAASICTHMGLALEELAAANPVRQGLSWCPRGG